MDIITGWKYTPRHNCRHATGQEQKAMPFIDWLGALGLALTVIILTMTIGMVG